MTTSNNNNNETAGELKLFDMTDIENLIPFTSEELKAAVSKIKLNTVAYLRFEPTPLARKASTVGETLVVMDQMEEDFNCIIMPSDTNTRRIVDKLLINQLDVLLGVNDSLNLVVSDMLRAYVSRDMFAGEGSGEPGLTRLAALIKNIYSGTPIWSAIESIMELPSSENIGRLLKFFVVKYHKEVSLYRLAELTALICAEWRTDRLVTLKAAVEDLGLEGESFMKACPEAIFAQLNENRGDIVSEITKLEQGKPLYSRYGRDDKKRKRRRSRKARFKNKRFNRK